MRKEIEYNKIDELLAKLSGTFTVADLTFEDLEKAADMKWQDFEDAIQSATASRINADYIITRNTKDFQDSRVRALTPEEYFSEVFSVDG